MPIWNPAVECASRDEIAAMQLANLKKQVAFAYEKSPYYSKVWRDIGLEPGDIKELSDIRKIPFTDKTSFREGFPYGMFAVPMDEVVRIHSSSGTTGKPVVVGYTRNDLDVWRECIARMASAPGVVPSDVVLMGFPFSMFTGGFGLFYGLEHIGCAMIPAGAVGTAKHLQFIEDYKPTVLISTPSYALHLAEAGIAAGFDWSTSTLRVGLFGGEPCTLPMKAEIEGLTGMVCTDNYGLTEVMGPGVSGECLASRDMSHINEDHFLCEIVDPKTGEPLPEGEEGELVITPLTKEATPVFRYRTHDLSYLTHEPCECGRTTARMKKVRVRTDDMLIIRGVNVFPSQFEDLLAKIEGASVHYRLVLTTESGMDALELLLELEPGMFTDSLGAMESFRRMVRDRIKTDIGINCKVTLVEPGSLERSLAKTKHVIDNRQNRHD